MINLLGAKNYLRNRGEKHIMKLQKHKTWKYKGTEYAKNTIVIPNKQIEELGWNEGDELESIIRGEKLVIVKKDTQTN
jgi:hypothetical protein